MSYKSILLLLLLLYLLKEDFSKQLQRVQGSYENKYICVFRTISFWVRLWMCECIIVLVKAKSMPNVYSSEWVYKYALIWILFYSQVVAA